VRRCDALQFELDGWFLTPLCSSVRYLRAYTGITGPLMDAFFGYLAWSQSHSEVYREQQRVFILAAIETTRQAIEKSREEIRGINLTELARLADGAGYLEGLSLNAKFDEPFRNADVVLNDIRNVIDTAPASWWSIYPWPERWPAALQNSCELYRQPCTGK
jgi:hypothetical protein